MNNERSSQRDRATRVTALRKNMKLSRGEFAKTLGIAKGTLQHWENLEDKSGLTERGAARLQKSLNNYGVTVSVTWLLHGIGERPEFPDSLNVAEHTNMDLSASPAEQGFIKTELDLFHAHYKQAVSFIVKDDKMSPLYNKGEVLAGVKLFEDQLRAALNKICIVMTVEGELLLRIVKESNIPLHYELTQLNHHEKPKITQLSFAAPISYVRKIVLQ